MSTPHPDPARSDIAYAVLFSLFEQIREEIVQILDNRRIFMFQPFLKEVVEVAF